MRMLWTIVLLRVFPMFEVLWQLLRMLRPAKGQEQVFGRASHTAT